MYIKSPKVEDDASVASSRDFHGVINIHHHQIRTKRHTDAASGPHICNPYYSSILQRHTTAAIEILDMHKLREH